MAACSKNNPARLTRWSLRSRYRSGGSTLEARGSDGRVESTSNLTVEDKAKDLASTNVDGFSLELLKELTAPGWSISREWISKTTPERLGVVSSNVPSLSETRPVAMFRLPHISSPGMPPSAASGLATITDGRIPDNVQSAVETHTLRLRDRLRPPGTTVAAGGTTQFRLYGAEQRSAAICGGHSRDSRAPLGQPAA